MKTSKSERHIIIPITCLIAIFMSFVCFTYLAYAAEIGEGNDGTTEVVARIEAPSDVESSCADESNADENSNEGSTITTGENPDTIFYILLTLILSLAFVVIIFVYPPAKHKSE